MNALTDVILSSLLSWIRVLIANLWSMVSSENGGAVYQFLSAHWMKILLVLCIGGYAVDRIVYFFRWRPHYVWLSRLNRLNRLRGKNQEDASPPQEWQPEPQEQQAAWKPLYGASFAPSYTQQEDDVSAKPTQVYAPVQEPVYFDENEDGWEDAWPDPEPQQPQHADAAAYYRDVQAGFAPPVPPEQLYTPSVHPGLKENVFRQSIGLEESEPQPVPVRRAPAFQPFTAFQEQSLSKADNPFARLAKRARDLMGTDADHELTIRDLQSTVDVSQAFHEPVYPQPTNPTNDNREVRR